MLDTSKLLFPSAFPAIRRARLETLQINLGYRCNQSCVHCHVAAGPERTEQMSAETVEDILRLLEAQRGMRSIDLTGGAPELNPHFRHLVRGARALGLTVTDRSNLTILCEPGQEGLAEFLAEQQVEVVASLPCYSEENVDSQRGRGSFKASIAGLRKLNALGYGEDGSGLRLNLVYNPLGPSLPPPQGPLEQDYKTQLRERYGIRFNQLFTITNMPIQRFGSRLLSKGEFDPYMRLLRESYCETNLDTVMCRHLISVDWRGYLFDCDFNQMLNTPLHLHRSPKPHIRDLIDTDPAGLRIQVGEHCYGCTAGQGSSCGGALGLESAVDRSILGASH